MKKILLPIFIFLSVILVACGNENTKPLTPNAGGGTPTPASTSTPTPAPTSTPVPTETLAPTETPAPTDTAIPNMQGALGGFAATDQENVYINDKVTSPSIPHLLIRLKDRLVTLYEDEVIVRYSVEEQKYAVTAYSIADWNKVGEKKLENLYTYEGMGFRWQLTDEVIPGENAFLIIDGGDPYYTLDIYDQALNVIEYNRIGSVYGFIADDANDRIILYVGMESVDGGDPIYDPYDYHI